MRNHLLRDPGWQADRDAMQDGFLKWGRQTLQSPQGATIAATAAPSSSGSLAMLAAIRRASSWTRVELAAANVSRGA